MPVWKCGLFRRVGHRPLFYGTGIGPVTIVSGDVDSLHINQFSAGSKRLRRVPAGAREYPSDPGRAMDFTPRLSFWAPSEIVKRLHFPARTDSSDAGNGS